MSGDLNFAFEPSDPTPMPEEAMLPAGAVVVIAALLDTPEGRMPALVFRFHRADGRGFYPPILLGLGDTADVARLRELLNAALDRVTEAAS